ncbi:DUF975 family protein [Butyrivibrio sp. CB08]|nr:DUF975 family protein [Butyrivibrio sp. CB08]
MKKKEVSVMWSIKELKEKGKAAFKGNYWKCVLVALILTIIAAGSSGGSSSNTTRQLQESSSEMTPEQAAALLAVSVGILVFVLVWILLKIFLLNIVEVGCYNFFKNNLVREGVDLSEIKAAFGANYKRSALTMFLRNLYTALWTLLLIIPGIVKSYSYAMVPFLIIDEPDLSANEIITRSREMMNGHKWRTFLLDLSFVGWILLTIITCGIVGVFWTNPYMYSTRAALYHELRGTTAAPAEAPVVTE